MSSTHNGQWQGEHPPPQSLTATNVSVRLEGEKVQSGRGRSLDKSKGGGVEKRRLVGLAGTKSWKNITEKKSPKFSWGGWTLLSNLHSTSFACCFFLKCKEITNFDSKFFLKNMHESFFPGQHLQWSLNVKAWGGDTSDLFHQKKVAQCICVLMVLDFQKKW